MGERVKRRAYDPVGIKDVAAISQLRLESLVDKNPQSRGHAYIGPLFCIFIILVVLTMVTFLFSFLQTT